MSENPLGQLGPGEKYHFMKNLFRLFGAWATGRYTVKPWRSIAILIFAVIYAIDPIDLIPDYIPVIGVIDDAAVFGLFIWSLRKDILKFLAWEEAQRKSSGPPPQVPSVQH
jgi:uncharacterized membrane protein YkvA (DUF1232 family)